jgi:hypothetical protein
MWHTQCGALFSHKKERNPVVCSKIHGTRGHLASKISQIQKDKYYMFSHMWKI